MHYDFINNLVKEIMKIQSNKYGFWISEHSLHLIGIINDATLISIIRTTNHFLKRRRINLIKYSKLVQLASKKCQLNNILLKQNSSYLKNINQCFRFLQQFFGNLIFLFQKCNPLGELFIFLVECLVLL